MKTIIFLCIAAFIYHVNCAPVGDVLGEEIRIQLLKTNPDIEIQKSILVYETSESGDVSNTINRIISMLLRDGADQFSMLSPPPKVFASFSPGTIASIVG